MSKVCRLCLNKLQKGAKYFNINAVESYTGFMPYRDQLNTCIPEMALDLIPNPIICWSCRSALKAFYTFKTRCLNVEKMLQQYAEYYQLDTITFNLTDIDTSPLSKSQSQHINESKTINKKKVKVSSLMLEKKNGNVYIKQETGKIETQSKPSTDYHIIKQNGEVLLPNLTEIEITNVSSSDVRSDRMESDNVQLSKKQDIQSELSIHTVNNSHDDEMQTNQKKDTKNECHYCSMTFPNQTTLHRHKTKIHDIYICNFCNLSFKTLQCLRRHNQLCQKLTNPTTIKNVLSRRPQLPTNAKNHLKRWLFRHTEHPYPTDLEKQDLMKETNLSLLQVENWFINARRRILNDMTRLKRTIFKDLEGYDNLFEEAAEKLFKEDAERTGDEQDDHKMKKSIKNEKHSEISENGEEPSVLRSIKSEKLDIKEEESLDNMNTDDERMDIEINQ